MNANLETITVTFNYEDADGFVFAILPTNKVTSTVNKRWDLSNFAKLRHVASLPVTFNLLTESSDFSTAIGQSTLVAKVLALGGVQSIIYSDLPDIAPEDAKSLWLEKKLTCVLLLDASARKRDYEELVMHLVEIITTTGRMKTAGVAKARKARETAELNMNKPVVSKAEAIVFDDEFVIKSDNEDELSLLSDQKKAGKAKKDGKKLKQRTTRK